MRLLRCCMERLHLATYWMKPLPLQGNDMFHVLFYQLEDTCILHVAVMAHMSHCLSIAAVLLVVDQMQCGFYVSLNTDIDHFSNLLSSR